MYNLEKSLPQELVYAEKLVHLMDDQFRIPIINYRIGLDPLIGLIPWIGDIVTFSISSLIVMALVKHGVSKYVMFKMIGNILLDLVIGGIPVIGDLWDFFNKANRKNLKLAKEYFKTME